MKDIYSLAEHVDVWLGPERSNDKGALDWIKSKKTPDQRNFDQVVRLCISIFERSWL